jgi:phosphatidylserine decarboxylase
MRDKSFMTLMKVLPKSALSTTVGILTRAPVPAPLHHAAMKAFAKAYRVELDEAEHGVESYRTFGEFFTRRLKPGARPVDSAERAVVSPVDGAVSQVGYSENGECLQAKGITYSVERLLGDAKAARPFVGGAYATLYLAPRDYHRIHSPLAGSVEGYSYVPGAFWPVNPISVRSVDALFCVNERLTTYLNTRAGKVAVVKVGATCVARIRASYDDVVTHGGKPGKEHVYEKPIPVGKGDELGMFEMGSTVILLFEKGRIRWDSSLVPEATVQVGKRIGELT